VFRVMQRHGLGRFRVVQKLSLTDAADVYRIENAAPEDWIMLGTHDTHSIWKLADEWCQSEIGAAWAKYLSDRLGPNIATFGTKEELSAQPGKLVNACFAAMLASEAKHVAVFFPDLFGLRDRYNEPGLISAANWSLRLPADFEQFYDRQLASGDALDVRKCLEAL
jgi:4-alpha-glucanotransferase